MRSWSIPLGRILGVELRLHFLFALLLGLVIAVHGNERHGRPAWHRAVAAAAGCCRPAGDCPRHRLRLPRPAGPQPDAAADRRPAFLCDPGIGRTGLRRNHASVARRRRPHRQFSCRPGTAGVHPGSGSRSFPSGQAMDQRPAPAAERVLAEYFSGRHQPASSLSAGCGKAAARQLFPLARRVARNPRGVQCRPGHRPGVCLSPGYSGRIHGWCWPGFSSLSAHSWKTRDSSSNPWSIPFECATSC